MLFSVTSELACRISNIGKIESHITTNDKLYDIKNNFFVNFSPFFAHTHTHKKKRRDKNRYIIGTHRHIKPNNSYSTVQGSTRLLTASLHRIPFFNYKPFHPHVEHFMSFFLSSTYVCCFCCSLKDRIFFLVNKDIDFQATKKNNSRKVSLFLT